MIKRTFYNLPSEKREKIIDVTKKEFSKGNKKKITINSVIEKAGISRGSFYQYFDDKLDLVELVTDDMMNKMVNFIQDELLLNSGDIFLVAVKIFDIMVAKKCDMNGLAVFDMDSNQNSGLISDYMQYRARHNNPVPNLIKYIDTNSFADKSEENVECVVFMLFDLIKTSAFNINKNIRSISEEKQVLIRKINILKNGALK